MARPRDNFSLVAALTCLMWLPPAVHGASNWKVVPKEPLPPVRVPEKLYRLLLPRCG